MATAASQVAAHAVRRASGGWQMNSVALRETSLRVGTPRESESWIVCRGMTRDVVDGSVACPMRGRVALDVCHDCRFLETVPGEWRRWSCGTSER
jgi:hypothetical protein